MLVLQIDTFTNTRQVEIFIFINNNIGNFSPKMYWNKLDYHNDSIQCTGCLFTFVLVETFEGIMHSHGHNTWEKPPFCNIVSNLGRWTSSDTFSDGTACNIIILKQGHLVEWGHLLEKGQLLIKTHSKKELIQKGARIGRRALINQIITVLSIKTITQHTVWFNLCKLFADD